MRHGCHLCVAILSIAVLSGTARAAITYSGSLSYSGGGIAGIADSPWLADGTTLSWDVTRNTNGTYTYKYRLQVPSASTKRILNLILEVSEDFESEDIVAVLQGTLAANQPARYPRTADWGMPAPTTDKMLGIRFSGGTGTIYDRTIEFTSTFAPTWGDLYARGGATDDIIHAAIWNTGFTNPDSDPSSPAANGSVDNHVLIPGLVIDPIPAPGALVLCSLGLALVSHLRRWRCS